MSGMMKNNGKREELLRYAAGEMSDKERNAFEKELQRDQFAADAAEGLSLLEPADAASDLDKLERRIKLRTARNNIVFYSGVAAVALLFIITSVIFLRPEGKVGPLSPTVAEETTAKRGDTAAGQDKVAATLADTALPVTDSVMLITATKPVATEATQEKSEYISRTDAPDREITLKDTSLIAAGAVQPVMIDPSGTTLQMKIAEDERITGIVTDETGKPFPFVNVYIQGQASTGTLTGEDGRFIIPVQARPDTGITVVAEFIGYRQLLVQADKAEMISIRMEPDIKALDEVVVVGYGEQKRKPVMATARSKEKNLALSDIILTGEVSEIIPGDTLQPPHYVPPAPVVGYRAFHEYIAENIRLPYYGQDTILKTVEVSLPVSHRGKKGAPGIVSSPGEWYSEEAKRLLIEGPEWQPAQRSGKAVIDTLRIRIRFVPARIP